MGEVAGKVFWASKAMAEQSRRLADSNIFLGIRQG